MLNRFLWHFEVSHQDDFQRARNLCHLHTAHLYSQNWLTLLQNHELRSQGKPRSLSNMPVLCPVADVYSIMLQLLNNSITGIHKAGSREALQARYTIPTNKRDVQTIQTLHRLLKHFSSDLFRFWLLRVCVDHLLLERRYLRAGRLQQSAGLR